MFTRLIRAAATALVLLTSMVAAPAFANVKTVNGISAEVNLPQIQRGVPYSFQIAPTGPTGYSGSYTFQLLSGTLPAGITVSSGGLVTGTTCINNGSYAGLGMRIRTAPGTTTADFTGSTAFSVNVTTAPANGCSITVTASTPSGTQGSPYTGSVTGAGAVAPYTYTVSSGALPPGVALNPSTGALSGTPTVPGTYTFSILVTDANSTPATGVGGPYTVTIAPSSGTVITVGPPTLPAGSSGVAYSQTFTAAGGAAPYAFTRTTGGLPAGLTLNAATGVLSGTPSAAGTYSFGIRATDANTEFGEQDYTVSIAAGNLLAINPPTLPGGTSGTAYSQAVSATGGAGGYTYAVTAGALPAGLSLDPATGAITGTPTAAGPASFTITATDTNGDYGSRAYSLTMAGGPILAVGPATLTSATTGASYTQALSGTGGTAPYGFSVTAGALPPGLSLASNGTLSGTPSTAGTYTFTVRVQDANGDYGTRTYSLVVAGADILTISPATLPGGTNGTAYSQALTAAGGAAPYAFSVTAGSLPSGLTLSGTGALSGTPTAAGTYTFTVQALDANGDFGTRSYTLVVAGADILTINPATLPNGANGTAYAQAITAAGGTSPYVFSLTAGSLPTGLTLSSTGTLSGTPTVAGSYGFTVQAVDANGDFGTRSYTVVIAGAASLAINPATLPNGTNGTAYNQAITATGGTSPYAYTVTAGSLPTGLTLSSTGALSGTPTVAGSYGFTVQAVDANGDFGTRSYTVVIAGAASLAINPATLPNGTNGTAYAQAITAAGGTSPYVFSLTAGSLPTGLTLSSTGALSGTPTVAGSYGFTVQAVDANGDFGTRSYTVVIAGAASLTINPATLPNGTNGTAYAQAITAAGGTSPYVFSLTAGSLPTGLTLSSTGALSGTPTVAGSYGFTVQAVDANGDFGTRSYTVVIAGAASLAINPATLPNGTNGTAYAQAITATGGTSPYAYTLTAGSLPAGLTLSSTGALSGTPTVAGSYGFTVQAVDANGNFGSRAYTLVVSGAAMLTVTPATLPGGNVQTPYGQPFSTAGGTAPYTYTTSAGSLPPGLTLSGAGLLGGTPTLAGTYTFTVRAQDANGNFGLRQVTVVIGLSIRPDPTRDIGVVETVGEQVGALRRAGELQMGHVMRRLDSGERCEGAPEQDNGDTPCDQRRVEAWAAGTSEQHFAVQGDSHVTALTVGADTRVGRGRVGAAIGSGQDMAARASGIRNDADARTAMLYGRWDLAPSLRLDALAGRSRVEIAGRRATADGQIAVGERDATSTFASLGIAGRWTAGAAGIAPYARYETARLALDAYTEQSTSPLALQYGAASGRTTAWVAGAEAFYGIDLSWGRLTPSARVEVRDRNGNAIAQGLWYADRPQTVYLLDVPGVSASSAMATLGLEAAFRGVTLKLEYGTAGSALRSFDGQTLRLQLRAGF